MKIQVKNISVYDDCLSFPLGEVRKLSFTLKNLGCAHGGEMREIKRHLWECQWTQTIEGTYQEEEMYFVV